jgi:DNA-binding response OmpR family regulator
MDVILTDILMPGNDGLELIPRLRSAQPGSKIIAMSEGAGAWESLSRAKSAGADDTITKPCSVQTLVDAISAQLKTTVLK